ncbi:MAG: glucohydrolase, partial [Bacteroidota bacterium]
QHTANGGDTEVFMQAVYEQGRDNVRTPIQWDNSPNGGFTDGTPWIKVNPNYKTINVAQALTDKDSIFYFYQQLLQFRKQYVHVFVNGSYRDFLPEHDQLFLYERRTEKEQFLIALNMSEATVEWSVPEGMELKLGNLPDVDASNLQPWEGRIYFRTLA